MDFVHISRVLIFANGTQKKISRVFNFAKSTKIREIRENLYTRKLVHLIKVYNNILYHFHLQHQQGLVLISLLREN